MNPSSVTGTANVVVKTKDLNGGMIDGPTNVATDAIAAGVLTSPMSFVAGTRTPGVTATATLSFSVTGSVVIGGKIVMVLPNKATVGCDSTWTMPAEPLISVSSPDKMLAAGVWTSASQRLEITTARSMIKEGARVVMQVHNVRTPSCLHTTGTANVTSYDGAYHVVDATTSVPIASMSIGVLGGDLTWTAASTVASVTTDSTVSFTSVGGIWLGGQIKVVLPATHGWSMPSTPVIEFSTPSGVTATAVWTSSDNTLLITTTNGDVSEGSAVKLVVKNTVTPPSATPSGTASIETFDEASVNAIDAGTLTTSETTMSAATDFWLLSLNTPGVADTATLTTTVSGNVGAGACIEIILPKVASAAHSWSMPAASRVVEFVEPSTNAGVASTTWNYENRALLIVTDSSTSITEGSKVVLRIRDLTTPSSVIGAAYTVIVTTYSSSTPDSTKITNFPTSVIGAAVPSGALTRGLWDMETDRPGVVSRLNMTFKTTGELKAGSTIELSLPHTLTSAHQRSWTMMNAAGSQTTAEQANPWVLDTSMPSVTCMVGGTSSVSVTTSWSRLSGVLYVTIAAGESSIPEGSNVLLQVADVGTPSSVVDVSTAELKTLDGSHQLIDGPVSVATEATTTGVLGGALTWKPASTIAGVTSDVTVSLSMGGWVPKQGVMEFVIPVVGESDGASAGAGVPSDGWRPQSDSQVVIVSPVGVATGVVNASLRKVTLTTDRPMLANEAIIFKVTRVMNPSSVTGTANVVVKTKDSANGGMIDGPTNVATDAITPGRFTAAKFVTPMQQFEVQHGGAARLSFKQLWAGPLYSGWRFVLRLPLSSQKACSWLMDSKPSTTALANDTQLLITSLWKFETQTLEMTYSCSNINASTDGAAINITVHTVRTPSTSLDRCDYDLSIRPVSGTYQSERGKLYCSQCVAGSITNTGDKSGATACIACPADKYSTSSNMTACVACPSGKHQPSKGQGLCKSCKAGKYSTAAGSRNVTDCIACVAGKYAAAAGSSLCTTCPTSKYQTEGGQSYCSQCEAGSITGKGTGTGARSCDGCAAGRYSKASTAEECDLCPHGYYNHGNSSFCISKELCIPGTYDRSDGTDITAGRCKKCPEQYFQPELNQPSCIACEGGQYQNKKGKSFCDQVPSDKALQRVESTSGQVTYDLVGCEAGSAAKDMQCRECPVGKVQPDAGKSACVQCLSEQYIRLNSTTRKPDRQHCDDCPRPGAVCNGANKTYEGNFWHEPSLLNPNASTNMYACTNDGCPNEGEQEMKCKDGYTGPLCAICTEGYFPQLRSCTDCGGSGPNLLSIILFVVSLVCIVSLVAMVYRHRRFLASTGVFAHVKILVSFATVMLTVDKQFGITWPSAFQRALAVLSVLSLDFGILGSLLCMADLSFYTNLLCTTLLLVALLACVFVTYLCLRLRQATSAHPETACLFVAVYLLLFAYPMVAVKVVELFGCHNVEGKYYLRADYSLECYTADWTAMAVYASAFLVTYVVGLPVFVAAKLWSYRHALREQVQGPGQVCKLAPKSLLLGFLLDDYVLKMPCYMWETEEMVRKLLLSVISNFWSDTSVMCVATALIISLVFQLCHTHYKPFKSPACNRLQQICLCVLNAVYIVGLLLKTQAVTTSDERDVGILLVLLLVSSVLALGCGIALEIRFLRHAWARMRKLTALLKKLPQQDPPDNDKAFYNIQIPVEESNMGDAFTPKKPEELAHLSKESKLVVVHQLSDENEGVLAAFLDQVSHNPMVPLQQVTAPTLVHSEGQMCVEWGRKTRESILQKANRPEIRKKNPKFGIEHLRDTFRFRATVYSFRDIVEFILAMHADPSLSGDGGLTPGNVNKDGWLIMGESSSGRSLRVAAGNVAKLDIKKLVTPRKTGWRFMALDFIMPNHQIVEVSQPTPLSCPLIPIPQLRPQFGIIRHFIHAEEFAKLLQLNLARV
eukprot:g342.t1